MDPLIIERTQMTPGISIEPDAGIIQISGRSIPDNPISFYQPVFDSIDQYKLCPKEKTEVSINLEYFNTSSLECLYMLFSKLAAINQPGKLINIHWYYMEGDLDMREAGEEFQTIIEIPIELIKYKKTERDSFYHNTYE